MPKPNASGSRDLIAQAIATFRSWNTNSRTRLERHKALKAALFALASRATLEYPLELNGRRTRVDFVGDGYAVELDHSMKPRSLAKLAVLSERGLKCVWIIMRPTGSYPRHFGKFERVAKSKGIRVLLLRGLGSPKPRAFAPNNTR
jgi:hypothetical protein